MAGRGAALAAAYDSAARQRQHQQFLGMNAYDRHRKLVHDLVAYYGAHLPAGGQVGAACGASRSLPGLSRLCLPSAQGKSSFAEAKAGEEGAGWWGLVCATRGGGWLPCHSARPCRAGALSASLHPPLTRRRDPRRPITIF